MDNGIRGRGRGYSEIDGSGGEGGEEGEKEGGGGGA